MAVPKGTRIGGRQKGTPNKVTADLKTAFQKHEKALVKEIMALTRDKDPRVRLGAVQAAFDRGWGKPAQSVELGGKDGGPLIVEIVRYSADDSPAK